MSDLLEAIRLHKNLPEWAPTVLPVDHRWTLVKPMTQSRYGTERLRWPAGLPGAGDEATWPEYDGHPNDPRGSDGPEHAATLDALSDVIGIIEHARVEVALLDDWTERAADLVRQAIAKLQEMEVES